MLKIRAIDSSIFFTPKEYLYHIAYMANGKNRWHMFVEKVRMYAKGCGKDPTVLSLVCRFIFQIMENRRTKLLSEIQQIGQSSLTIRHPN
jgi:hypothetical protein